MIGLEIGRDGEKGIEGPSVIVIFQDFWVKITNLLYFHFSLNVDNL